ncbi:MAG: hypothetical protein HUU23_00530 [Caldilineales bacterium]|nr:hypothetical protein [Caldilineales bacterium]
MNSTCWSGGAARSGWPPSTSNDWTTAPATGRASRTGWPAAAPRPYANSRKQGYEPRTARAWLIGPFVSAHLRVYQDRAAARAFLLPFIHHLSDHGLGSISEIFDGDPPFTPRGCIAQAWSVAAVLRAWQATAPDSRV